MSIISGELTVMEHPRNRNVVSDTTKTFANGHLIFQTAEELQLSRKLINQSLLRLVLTQFVGTRGPIFLVSRNIPIRH